MATRNRRWNNRDNPADACARGKPGRWIFSWIKEILPLTGKKLTEAMHLLPQHLWSNKRYAIRADIKTLAVFFRIDADFQPLRNFAALVHNGAFQRNAASNLHIGQQSRVFDIAMAIDAHIGK